MSLPSNKRIECMVLEFNTVAERDECFAYLAETAPLFGIEMETEAYEGARGAVMVVENCPHGAESEEDHSWMKGALEDQGVRIVAEYAMPPLRSEL